MKNYTLGFIFTPEFNRVLLIHKTKPEWQAGKINGIGGKIEEGESPLECIVREVREEAGLATAADKWIYLGEMGSDMWRVYVFATVYRGCMDDAKSPDEEKVEWFDPAALPGNIINNLTWLVPLALDKMRYGEFQDFSMRYHERPAYGRHQHLAS
ncbi:MAG: NUDIX domain-containing protein [Patescibacteria group bacterium]